MTNKINQERTKKEYKEEILKFKFHTTNFFKELAECGLDRKMGVYKIPLNEFMRRLAELAQIGSKIHNPLLDLWLFDMCLYEEANPESKEYNPKLREQILKKIKSRGIK